MSTLGCVYTTTERSNVVKLLETGDTYENINNNQSKAIIITNQEKWVGNFYVG